MRSKISFFNPITNTKPVSDLYFIDYLKMVKDGAWEDAVIDYRVGKIKKIQLPGVTASGKFQKRNTAGLLQHSGIINIDIDAKDNPDVDLREIRSILYTDPHVFAGHLSVSKNGLSLYIKISAKKHYESFIALEKYFANEYHIVIDKSAKDVTRLRFVSFDPDLFINEHSQTWRHYLEKEKAPPRNFSRNLIVSKDDFGYVLDQIISGAKDIAEDYHEWLNIGFALASEFGESGREKFHAISRNSTKYTVEATDRKYNQLLRSSSGKFSIGTFFWHAKNAGCSIKSPRTQRIEDIGKIKMKQVGKGGGFKTKEMAIGAAKEYLATAENISGEDVEDILKQVSELPEKALREKTDLAQQAEFLKLFFMQKGVKRNTLTDKVEINGKQLVDRTENQLFLDVIESDDKIKRDLFMTVLNSDAVQEFNPFLQFFNDNKDLKPEKKLHQLIMSIEMDEDSLHGISTMEYKYIFVRKWLLGMIAAMNGDFSVLVMVLIGKQGINKTNFFRNLLPKELRRYYAENKMDDASERMELLSSKLLVVDDEFGGKTKRESKLFKEMTSVQEVTYRPKYGRHSITRKRMAVLAGTTNDEEILIDQSGNRRIAPLKIKGINREIYDSIDKTELFMELYWMWKEDPKEFILTQDEIDLLNESTGDYEDVTSEADWVSKFCRVDNEYKNRVITAEVEGKYREMTGNVSKYRAIANGLRKAGFEFIRGRKDGVKNPTRIWNIRILTVDEERNEEQADLPF